MSILSASDLSAGYGDADIISGIALRVEPQEIVTVAGSNGRGQVHLRQGDPRPRATRQRHDVL